MGEGLGDRMRKARSGEKTEKDSMNVSAEYAKRVREYSISDDTALTALQVRQRIIQKASYILSKKKKEFVIDKENKGFLNFLSLYLAHDERVFKHLSSSNHKVINEFSFDKGLTIAGSYGLGKSLILQAASQSQVPGNKFGFVTTNIAVQFYEENGPKQLSVYFRANRAFDDIGTESRAWYYGKQVDIFKVILEERYNAFIHNDIKTHLSTNLTIGEIGKRYGHRVESRLYESSNILVLTGQDRRKK